MIRATAISARATSLDTTDGDSFMAALDRHPNTLAAMQRLNGDVQALSAGTLRQERLDDDGREFTVEDRR